MLRSWIRTGLILFTILSSSTIRGQEDYGDYDNSVGYYDQYSGDYNASDDNYEGDYDDYYSYNYKNPPDYNPEYQTQESDEAESDANRDSEDSTQESESALDNSEVNVDSEDNDEVSGDEMQVDQSATAESETHDYDDSPEDDYAPEDEDIQENEIVASEQEQEDTKIEESAQEYDDSSAYSDNNYKDESYDDDDEAKEYGEEYENENYDESENSYDDGNYDTEDEDYEEREDEADPEDSVTVEESYAESNNEEERAEETRNQESGQKKEEEYYEYEDDMDTLYRNYEILSEFYQKYFVDLRVLDNTCDPTTYPAPSIQNGRIVKYAVVDNVLLPKKQYRQVIYSCNRGYKFSSRASNSMFCQEFTWIGLEPDCEESDEARYGDYDDEDGGDGGGHGQGPDHQDQAHCPHNSGCPQECRMENGYPVCYCSDGFVEVNGDCSDINECDRDNGGCEEGCQNKPGSYMCSCPTGYELSDDGHSCVDTNECLANNGHGPCQDVCMNVDGYYYCECRNIPGTQLDEDRHTCTVVNLCDERNGGCSHYCHSTHGQSYCSCPAGYELSEDFKTCKDINECATVQDVCDESCENLDGSYKCVASSRNVHTCPTNHALINGICQPKCRDGEELVSGRCLAECGPSQSRDEDDVCQPRCTDGMRARSDGVCVSVCYPGVCGDHGKCQDGYDGYMCTCDQGYHFQSGTCLDTDECQQTPDLCTPHGQCTNTIGSFYCHCMPGYRNKDGNCVDVDECSESVVCAQKCVNTVGSYYCECWEGYSLAAPGANTCVDIDECSLRPAICEQHCRNLAGGFKCICQQGFTQDPNDNTKCVSITGSQSVVTCPRLDAPTGGKLTCSGPETGPVPAGTQCTLACKKGYLRQGNSQRSCMDTGEWDNGVGWCQEASCLALPPVSHGEVTPQHCLTDRQQVKSRCKITCDTGYSLQGSSSAICGRRGRWIYRRGSPSCVGTDPATHTPDPEHVSPSPPSSDRPPTSPATSTESGVEASGAEMTTPEPKIAPYIICPSDILVNLTEPSPVKITIPPPKTNLAWGKVWSEPAWAKQLTFSVAPGTVHINFNIKHPDTDQIITCRMTIRTVDTKPPDVRNCPNSFSVFLDQGKETKVVEWEEPIFTDNVGVTSVLASQLPGQHLGKGRHVVIYQALDAQGNRERCVFSIRVANLSPEVVAKPKRIWVLCRVGNTGRQIRLLVTKVPPGCRRIKIRT